MTGQTFYFAYDPSKGTLGDYRQAMQIGATDAIDKDTRHYYEPGQWKIEYPYPNDTTHQGWTTDDTVVTSPGQYTATSHWWDDADLPEGEKPSRDDSPDSAYDVSVTIVVWEFRLLAPKQSDADPQANNYCFNHDNPGVLTVPCQASLVPSDIAADIRWESAILGSSFSPNHGPEEPLIGAGLTPTLTVNGLYGDNQRYGRHLVLCMVILKQECGGGQCMEIGHADVFYHARCSNHPSSPPDPLTPNWFYYWHKTSAACGNPAYDPFPTDKAGYCIWGVQTFLTGLIVTDTPIPWTTWVRKPVRDLFTAARWTRPIDYYAQICRHEQRHVDQGQEWILEHGSGPPWNIPHAALDTDWLKDSFEFASGGEPLTWDPHYWNSTTLGGPIVIEGKGTECELGEDSEDDAEAAELTWANGSADSEDWSDLGWQWEHY